MILAITRDVSPRLNDCEITHIDRAPMDVKVAQAQHDAYVRALKELGCERFELKTPTARHWYAAPPKKIISGE